MSADILVIDDEEIVRRSCQRTLAPLGYRVVTEEFCVDGLERLKERHFDLVLTDLKMPHMDGLELAAHISAKYPGTKVILFTGYTTDETIALALRQGIHAYMEKPFTPEKLKETVRKALGEGKAP
jgi:DNA-binding NtrC family response regulator